VPCQEDPTHTVCGGLPFVTVEAGEPPRAVHPIVSADDPGGGGAHLLQVDGASRLRLAAAGPGDHPVPPVTEGHDDRESCAAGSHSEPVLRRVGHLHISQHYGLQHRPARESHTETTTHCAVHAVGTDHIAAAELGSGTVLSASQ